MIAPLPPNETQRLEALRQYAVLDTPAERAFDDITALSSRICNTPIAPIFFVDADRFRYRHHQGLPDQAVYRDCG